MKIRQLIGRPIKFSEVYQQNTYPVELPDADVKVIAERFYDEERFLKDAMRELRSKKARGESVDLAALLADVGVQKPKAIRKPRKPKSTTDSATPVIAPDATV